MTVFISGGAKNGKSTYAQRLALALANGGRLYYVATMIPHDEEDCQRIRRHIADRDGMGFETLEVGRDICSCLEKADVNATFLIDSLTALLLNEMYSSHGGEADVAAPGRVADGLKRFVKSVKNTVMVSDYIYSDAVRCDTFTEAYRKALAFVDSAAVSVSNQVVEMCCGNAVYHKGSALI